MTAPATRAGRDAAGSTGERRKQKKMGLDFSHTDARWSYSGFHYFRIRLAKEIGIDLESMAGFDGKTEWPSATKDPIIWLLSHSDCDGHITPKRCAKIAPRLRELVSKWPDEYDKQRALMLADGMESAAAANEKLIFC
jgi:hypothetical protein